MNADSSKGETTGVIPGPAASDEAAMLRDWSKPTFRKFDVSRLTRGATNSGPDGGRQTTSG